MKSFLIFLALLFILVIGGLLNRKRVWHRCIWCRCYFDDVGNTQDSHPAAVIDESVDRCGGCRELAEKEAVELKLLK